MSTPINTIFSWFETGDFPTQQQFQATFSSFFHKDENIPAEKIEGLSQMFEQTVSTQTIEAHFRDENAHADYLAKINAGNLNAENVNNWKTKLGISRIATVDTTPGEDDGNVFNKEQIGEFFSTVNGRVDEWSEEMTALRALLESDDLSLDEMQEVVNFIKQNRADIELLQQISIGNTTDDKVSLIADYDQWGGITLQNQFNDVVYDRIIDIESKMPVGRTYYSIAVTGDTTITHNLNTNYIICEAHDEVTGYTLPIRVRRVNLNTIDIEFDGDIQNTVQVIIKKII